MEKFGKSQSTKRVEDIRLLIGAGRFVDDITPAGALYAHFFRASVAHGVITTLDVNEARALEGVHLVMTGDDILQAGVTEGMTGSTVPNRDGTKAAAPRRPFLAEGRVRHVGEPLVMIVADSKQQALDAAELIELDVDELPVKLDKSAGGQAIHAEAPDNRAFDWAMGDEASVEAALNTAAHVVRMYVDDNRIIVNPMEPRGCFAEMQGDRLHLAFNGQGVWGMKSHLAKVLNMPKDAIRVTNPDVGGGFGMKAMPYPEYYTVALAAKLLKRPVRWMSERTEAMLSDHAGRDLDHQVALGFDADLRLTAYRVDSRCNLGAFNSHFGQNIQTALFSKVLTGVYDIPTAYLHVEGFYTNTTQVDAYRGAGRPEAIYVLERAMDQAARELGVDPWDLRRRNFIHKDQFPYTSPTGSEYDVGDFHAVLDHVEQLCDLGGFSARVGVSADRGKLRGLGLCFYIESILGDPSETTTVTFNDDGTATIYVGTQSNGQGHETVMSKFLSDQTGIPLDKIRFVQGDSDVIANGGGTGGSRSVTVQNTATLAAVDTMVAQFSAFLADQNNVALGDVHFDHEQFRIDGTNLSPTMLEVAEMARIAERTDLLRVSETLTLDARSFPNGAHVAEAEIDPETGEVTIDRYSVVDDFGNLINPMLVEGQIHGGVAQGLGQAITERVVFDDEGQLLTATFMDYAMPRASDMPFINFETAPTPSTTNAMGMKGCGEAGTVGAMAAVANAIYDGLYHAGVRKADMPFTPQRVWGMLQDVEW